ncbi:hypothetical protein [Enterococcus hirae]|uniref:hypothetical protein n=1 Tax=Enterococcus hirae TaxID=1354 RepID=UPI00136FDA3C|nr:hypothetical protein [Enterococcus hirae]NAE18271.1 hypothetical protein [Enterococcus hirae]
MNELPHLEDLSTSDQTRFLARTPLRERKGMRAAATDEGSGYTAIHAALDRLEPRLGPTEAHQPATGPQDPSGVALLEARWLVTPTTRVLHHASLTTDQHHELATDGYLDRDAYDTPLRLTCGRTTLTVATPGVLERMTRARCETCCTETGYPDGVGSPANDDTCAARLTQRLEDAT